jgi:flagellin-like protein
MQIRKLLNDDDAVSPVIGVILMVAITVILAAVIASFVLGLGDQAADSSPQASFGFDYDESNSVVTVSHTGGDSIEVPNLYIRGDQLTNNAQADQGTGQWAGSASGGGSTSTVSSGDTTDVGTSSNSYTLSVVFEASSGDSSSTLASDEGPAA